MMDVGFFFFAQIDILAICYVLSLAADSNPRFFDLIFIHVSAGCSPRVNNYSISNHSVGFIGSEKRLGCRGRESPISVVSRYLAGSFG